MGTQAYARAPQPARNTGRPYQYPRQAPIINPAASTVAAQRDYARRTPGVLGASNGGAGLMPQKQWNLNFPNRANDGAEGITEGAAPPATNFRPGDAGTNSLAPVRQVATTAVPIGVPLTGNKAVDDANQKAAVAANLALAKNPTAPAGTEGKAGPATDPNDYLNSAAVQGALNAANGNGNITPTATGGNALASTYGSGSSHPGVGQPTAAETAAATTSTGVAHPDWQQQVMAKYRTIADPNHEDNKAYISAYNDALNTKGAGKFDPVALADTVMGKRTAEINQDASDESQADKDSIAAEQTRQDKANAPITENSPIAKAVGAYNSVVNAPGSVADSLENAASGVMTAAGLNPNVAKGVAAVGRNATDKALDYASGGDDGPPVKQYVYSNPSATPTATATTPDSNFTAPAGAMAGATPYTFPTTPPLAQNGQPGSGLAQNSATPAPRTSDEDEE